jgi:hypothetical protein
MRGYKFEMRRVESTTDETTGINRVGRSDIKYSCRKEVYRIGLNVTLIIYSLRR